MARRRRLSERGYLLISAVAQRFDIHPQTLRLYERQGLIRPARSSGNTRLYDARAVRRIEMILTLTRDLGVNLAGVEVILNLREQMEELEREVERLMGHLEREMQDRRAGVERAHALVKVERGALTKR